MRLWAHRFHAAISLNTLKANRFKVRDRTGMRPHSVWPRLYRPRVLLKKAKSSVPMMIAGLLAWLHNQILFPKSQYKWKKFWKIYHEKSRAWATQIKRRNSSKRCRNTTRLIISSLYRNFQWVRTLRAWSKRKSTSALSPRSSTSSRKSRIKGAKMTKNTVPCSIIEKQAASSAGSLTKSRSMTPNATKFSSLWAWT